MKKISKIVTIIFAIVMAMASFGFTSCDSGVTTGSKSKNATSDVDIINFDYGFLEAAQYVEDVTTVADTQRYTTLDAGTDYYLIVTFDISSREDNAGTSLLKVYVELDDINILTGTIAESNGVSIPMEFNVDEEKKGLRYQTDFKIPDQTSTPKNVYIIMELTPAAAGQAHVYLELLATDFNIYGNDGFTKDLTVNKVQLEAPVLEFMSNTGTLSWNQIENADYYVIYVDDELLMQEDGETAVGIDVDSNVAVGSEVLFANLYEYISGYHRVRIQARSYKIELFTDSNYSNLVYVTI